MFPTISPKFAMNTYIISSTNRFQLVMIKIAGLLREPKKTALTAKFLSQVRQRSSSLHYLFFFQACNPFDYPVVAFKKCMVELSPV